MINNFEIYYIDELINELIRSNNNSLQISVTYLNKCFDNEEYMFTKIFFDYLSIRYAKTRNYTDELKLFGHSKIRESLRNKTLTNSSPEFYEECVNDALYKIMGNCMICNPNPVNMRISCNYNKLWPTISGQQSRFVIDNHSYILYCGPDIISIESNGIASNIIAALVMKKEYFFPMLFKFLSTKINEQVTFDSEMFEFFYVPEEIEKIMSLNSRKRKSAELTLYNINEVGIPFVEVSQERMNKLMPVDLRKDIMKKKEYSLNEILNIVQTAPELL